MPSAPLRVLIVEDYADLREMYAEYLRFHGFDVEEAADGIEGVERARAVRPNVVLMDLSLPGLSGRDAIRQLRLDPLTEHAGVIALTGDVPKEQEWLARMAGCDGFVTKPSFPEDLLAEIRRVLAAKS